MNEIIDRVMKNFKRNNINAYHISEKAELPELLNNLILENCTVGCGDSVTLEQLGVFNHLRNSNVIFYDKHKIGLTSDEKREIYLNNFRADVFISGANAITENGEILNIDGNGSRVAPMLYGPKKVILVVGTNKIAKNRKEGWLRVRQVAAPLDAVRLGRNTPCALVGKCVDCQSSSRICNDFVMIARQFDPDRIHVIIIDGEYGY